MSKICEAKVCVENVNNGEKTVSVFVFASGENYGDVTIAYEKALGDESLLVYEGHINISDPGEGPTEEYENREEALASEYKNAFDVAFYIAGRADVD